MDWRKDLDALPFQGFAQQHLLHLSTGSNEGLAGAADLSKSMADCSHVCMLEHLLKVFAESCRADLAKNCSSWAHSAHSCHKSFQDRFKKPGMQMGLP